MRLVRYLSVVIVVVLPFAPSARAQQAASASPLKSTRSTSLGVALNRAPSAPSEAGVRTVTLGDATVPLDGLWKCPIHAHLWLEWGTVQTGDIPDRHRLDRFSTSPARDGWRLG